MPIRPPNYISRDEYDIVKSVFERTAKKVGPAEAAKLNEASEILDVQRQVAQRLGLLPS
jgi:hypothetical protein